MTIDRQRRKAVMSRSMRLGHCVCNPKNPCPCPIFIEHNICPCAGEKQAPPSGPVALTRHVRKAGCASKISQSDLKRILGALPVSDDPNILVGAAAGDDAGVYQIDATTALVQTVDVFTPCVDDARQFGQIAAANSVSDVYAMGGRPLSALSIIGFPIDTLDGAVMEAMLRGGIEKMAEAGCPVIGGHSINDEEIKLGFAVTGLIHPDRVTRRSQSRDGDVLVLTKPLGTGMLCFAAQLGRLAPAALEDVGAAMATLNRDAAELMTAHGAHACTDVTGFGLAGHLAEMARESDLTAEIEMEALPVFSAVRDCIDQGVLSGAIERNQEYAQAWVTLQPPEATSADVAILYDPQTSGGLLVALPPNEAGAYVNAMRERGHSATSVIGRMRSPDSDTTARRIIVTGLRLQNYHGAAGGLRSATAASKPSSLQNKSARGTQTMRNENTEPNTLSPLANPISDAPCCDGQTSCCASAPDSRPPTAANNERPTLDLFMDFMKAANTPGAIDATHKRLMAIALSVATRCKPCLKTHLKAARDRNIDPAAIEEAIQLALVFSGGPALMLVREVHDELAEAASQE